VPGWRSTWRRSAGMGVCSRQPGVSTTSIPNPGSTHVQHTHLAGDLTLAPCRMKATVRSSLGSPRAPTLCCACLCGSGSGSGATSCEPCPLGCYGDSPGATSSDCAGACPAGRCVDECQPPERGLHGGTARGPPTSTHMVTHPLVWCACPVLGQIREHSRAHLPSLQRAVPWWLLLQRGVHQSDGSPLWPRRRVVLPTGGPSPGSG
jgi:hypothetical protein